MLVLSRQRDETIMIGDEIEITVVDIRGDKVRLGINAPNRISVHRKEVYDAIREENERAAALRGQLAPTDFDVLRRTIGAGPAKSPARERTRLIATPHVGNPATGAKGSQRGRNSGNNGGVAKSA
jgi:carbon storage regulator